MQIKYEEKQKVRMENHESKKNKRFHGENKKIKKRIPLMVLSKKKDLPLDSYNYQYPQLLDQTKSM